MLAITYKKITKIKVAEWGTPKKYLKKYIWYERVVLDLSILKILIPLNHLIALYVIPLCRAYCISVKFWVRI
jgi:hypothetical protein